MPPAMLRRAWLLLLLLSSCTSARAPQATGARTFPDVSLVGLDGSPVQVPRAARGRVAVVDLWATWCEACKREHEVLERLARAHTAEDLLIVGVSVGEEAKTVRRYVQQHPFSYPILLDPRFALTDALQETELPAVYVLDRGGRVVHRTTKIDRETLALIRAQLTATEPSITSGR